MATSVLFGRKDAKIGVLQLDATVNEEHAYRNEVSEWPVEDGSTIIDNIRLVPEKITIQGLVTNSPVDFGFQDITNIVTGGGNKNQTFSISRDSTPTRVESAQNILLRLSGRVINGKDTKPEITEIVTGLRVYKNMALTNLSINRNGRTGQALPFTAEFVKVQSVEIKTVDAQPSVADKASKKIPKGKQKVTTAPVKTEEKSVSVLKNVFNKLNAAVN